MKQMDECLDRAFAHRQPLRSRKWKAFWGHEIWADEFEGKENHLLLFHYQHLVLVYDVKNGQILHEWWELPTDKRGLDAAKDYLNKRLVAAR